MKFLTHVLAVVAALLVGLQSSPTFAAKKKLNKAVKPKVDDRLGVMTFEQVARLSHSRRVEYISLIRQATKDIDQFQRMFGGRATTASLGTSRDNYAVLELLLGTDAVAAADAQWKNQCLYAGNISSYPSEKGGEESRVPFECKPVDCKYGSNIRGVRCNFTYSGLTNEPGLGCLPIEKTNNAINKAFASQACWDQRTMYAEKNAADVRAIVSEANAYFFDKSEFDPKIFDTKEAKDIITKLIKTSYSDDSYAQLVKVAYFYQSQGKKFPDGIPNYLGDGEAKDTLDKVGANVILDISSGFNDLNKAADRIFAAHINHCAQYLPNNVVADIHSGINLSRVGKGTSAYLLEADRQSYLKQVCSLSAKPTKEELDQCAATHENVLEVKECELVKLRFDNLKKKLEDIAGSYPRLKNGEPPPTIATNPIGPDDRVDNVEPSGCNENITAYESGITQPAARCLICMIQSHEEKKARQIDEEATFAQKAGRSPALTEDQKNEKYYLELKETQKKRSTGDEKISLQLDIDHIKFMSKRTYAKLRPSKKYTTLVSTMVLACGDGLTNDTTVSPEMLRDYWYSFGHCASDTYEWTGGEDRDLTNKWADKNNHWKLSKDKQKNEDPDKNNAFARNYGISFKEATKLFCDPERFDFSIFGRRKGFNDKEWNKNRGENIRTRREQFVQNKRKIKRGKVDSPADNLMRCMAEAEKNTLNFHSRSNMCSELTPLTAQKAFGPTEQKVFDDFLLEPPMLTLNNDCFVPKQKQTVEVLDDKGTPCYKTLADKQNPDKVAACKRVGKSVEYYVWVNPASVNIPDNAKGLQGQRRYSAIRRDKDYRPEIVISELDPPPAGAKATYISGTCPITDLEAKSIMETDKPKARRTNR